MPIKSFPWLSFYWSYLDLGTFWMELLVQALKYSEPLKEAVGMPEAHTRNYPMALGYPKFESPRLPE